MAMETLDLTAADVEYGDHVQTAGSRFWAHSNAEMDQWGDININDGERYRTFPPRTTVQITREVKAEAYSY